MSPSPATLARLRAAAAALLPPECAVEVCRGTDDGDPASLPPEEAVALRQAGPTRRRDFIAGRTAARAALHRLGHAAVPIPVSPDRAPHWPAGIVGSISHTHGTAIVTVAPARQIAALGLDLELDCAVPAELWSEVLVPAEREHLARIAPADRPRHATLLFSAKEAFFKLQYPASRRQLGFADITVQLETSMPSFRIAGPPALSPWLHTVAISARFALVESFILTLLWARPAPAP